MGCRFFFTYYGYITFMLFSQNESWWENDVFIKLIIYAEYLAENWIDCPCWLTTIIINQEINKHCIVTQFHGQCKVEHSNDTQSHDSGCKYYFLPVVMSFNIVLFDVKSFDFKNYRLSFQ